PELFQFVVPLSDRGRRESRAPTAPVDPVRGAHGHPVYRSTRARTTGTAETSRLSPRNGFTAYTYSPRGAAVLAPVAGGSSRRRSARVAAPGPHDFAVRCSDFARRANPPDAAASIATRANVS